MELEDGGMCIGIKVKKCRRMEEGTEMGEMMGTGITQIGVTIYEVMGMASIKVMDIIEVTMAIMEMAMVEIGTTIMAMEVIMETMAIIMVVEIMGTMVIMAIMVDSIEEV